MAEGKKKGKNIVMILLGILILVSGTLALLIAFNPGNVNSTLQNVPILGSFVPKEEEKPELTLEQKYGNISKPKLKEAVFALAKENELLNEKVTALTTEVTDKNKEIETLKQYEATYTSLKTENEKLTNALASKDKAAFADYYEKANPELAKQIYAEITKDKVADSQTAKYISKLNEMDVTLVAKMMDDMAKTDFDQVVKILQNMDDEQCIKVIQKMDSKNAIKITKKLTGGLQ